MATIVYDDISIIYVFNYTCIFIRLLQTCGCGNFGRYHNGVDCVCPCVISIVSRKPNTTPTFLFAYLVQENIHVDKPSPKCVSNFNWHRRNNCYTNESSHVEYVFILTWI
jgi:hypothetical protein